MWERVQKFFDRFESRWSLLSLFIASGAAGVVTGWIASGAEWVNQYGRLGWWSAFLLGFAISAWGLAGISWARSQWTKGSAIRKWKEDVSSFNPLDSEFTKLRMRISDLVNPITQRIADKRLTDCELIGPANVAFLGVGNMYGTTFMNCDVVAVRADALIRNVVVFENVEIVRGRLFNCTVFVPPAVLPQIMAIPGAFSLSLTGNAEYDRRTPH